MNNVPTYSVYQLNLEAQRRVRDIGLSVSIDEKASTAYTTGGSIHLPLLRTPMDVAAFKKARGYLIHEVAHNQPWNRKAFDILREVKLPAEHPLKALFNMTEDARIERDAAARNKGDAKALSDFYGVLIPEETQKWSDTWARLRDHELDEDTVKGAACNVLSWHSGEDWNRGTLGIEQLAKTMGTEVHALMHKLIDEGWLEKFREMTDAHSAWALAKELYARLYPDEPDPEESPQEELQSKGTGEEGTGEESETPASGSDDAATEGESSSSDTKVCVKWSELVHSAFMDDATEGTKASVEIKYDSWSDEWVPMPKVHWQPLKGEDREARVRGYTPNNDANAAALANQIRKYIMSKRRLSYTHDLEEGEIDTSSLYRLTMPGYSESKKRVFMEPKRTKGLNTAITLLVDGSGSMTAGDSHTRFQTACMATHRMLEVFERSLRVPCEVLGYTTKGTPDGEVCSMMELKRFSERYCPSVLANKFADAATRMQGNADADAVLAAYHRLLGRKESRRILIVLSDGYPTDSYAGDACHGLRTAVKDVKDAGLVDLHGIGIATDSPKDFYGKHTQCVYNLKDLDGAILSTLRRGFE